MQNLQKSPHKNQQTSLFQTWKQRALTSLTSRRETSSNSHFAQPSNQKLYFSIQIQFQSRTETVQESQSEKSNKKKFVWFLFSFSSKSVFFFDSVLVMQFFVCWNCMSFFNCSFFVQNLKEKSDGKQQLIEMLMNLICCDVSRKVLNNSFN